MREKKFKEARELFNTSNAILLNWATGVGKTLASLRLVGESGKVVVLCAQLAHIDNWRTELKKYGLELDIEFHTYASMHKVSGKGYDLILDESHWSVSDLRLSKLKDLNYRRIVLLSASMEVTDIDKIKTVVPNLEIHEVSLQEAIDLKILPEPEITVVELELDSKMKQCIHFKKRGKNGEIFTCTYGSYFKTLKKASKLKNYVIVCACTEKQKYDLLTSEASYLKKQAYYNDHLWKVYSYRRLDMKKFVAERKTQYATTIIDGIKTRTIVFAANIHQAEQLGRNPIHSKNHKKVNSQILENFNKKNSNLLITVQMLRESANLVDIEEGLIVQIDNKLRSPIQMVGRILRGKFPKISILCFINTVDDEYVRTHLQDLNHVRKTFNQIY